MYNKIHQNKISSFIPPGHNHAWYHFTTKEPPSLSHGHNHVISMYIKGDSFQLYHVATTI